MHLRRPADFRPRNEDRSATGAKLDDGPDLRACTLKLRTACSSMTARRSMPLRSRLNIQRMMDKQRNPTNRPLWDPLAGVETPDANTIVIRCRSHFHNCRIRWRMCPARWCRPRAIHEIRRYRHRHRPRSALARIGVDSFDPGTATGAGGVRRDIGAASRRPPDR